jgi:hypothetical protein
MDREVQPEAGWRVQVINDRTGHMASASSKRAVTCSDWQHTNARRSAERNAYRLRRLYPRKALRLAGQLPLLPGICSERPQN